MCLYIVGRFALMVAVLRSTSDAMRLYHIWLQLKLAYVSKESLVVGCGKLVWDARQIALHYLRSLGGFWFDLFVILPVPQVQRELGCTNALASDITAACSGFVMGLVTATHFIKGGGFENILVVGADALSRYVDWTDRGTCILFGSAAGAVLLQAERIIIERTIMQCMQGIIGHSSRFFFFPFIPALGYCIRTEIIIKLEFPYNGEDRYCCTAVSVASVAVATTSTTAAATTSIAVAATTTVATSAATTM